MKIIITGPDEEARELMDVDAVMGDQADDVFVVMVDGEAWGHFLGREVPEQVQDIIETAKARRVRDGS